MLHRIVRHAEYLSFIKAVRSFRLDHFYVPVLEAESGVFAYGITIMKKIGNAVRRNKLKRRIKSWFRENEALLPTGLKVNLIAREGAAELSWTELSSELNDLAGMLKQ